MGRLTGKITIVTGASAGIGEMTARVFSRQGATVELVALREDRLHKITAEIIEAGGQAAYVVADLALCRAALKHMEARAYGSIINISSIGARGLAGAAYSSAKAGVISLTRNIAIQYAGKGIRCMPHSPALPLRS